MLPKHHFTRSTWGYNYTNAMVATIYHTDYYPLGFAERVVNAVVGFIEGAFALRILLQLLGANQNSEFVAWVYGVTQSLLGPFAGAFPAFAISPTAVLDFSVILAMIGYSILGWLVIRLLHFIFLSPVVTVDHSEHQDMPLRG